MVAREEKIYPQSGVVPIRRNGGVEILIITNTGATHWIFPKGLIEDQLSAEESAAKEAYEEAGVRGRVGRKVGDYEYKKWDGVCQVEMFLLEDVEELDEWPEDYRSRKWVALEKLFAGDLQEDLEPILRRLREIFD